VEDFGERKSLGTDGFPPDMFEEARAAYFRNRESGKGTPAGALCLVANGLRIASELFGRPFGLMRRDSPADLIVVRYVPPTPLTDENLAAHLLFGLRPSMVESVMVNGRWILYRGGFPHLHEEELLRDAQAAARKLWSAMHALRS
jgi:cytosine/adenosine deaminase-related metal-dependent hydrolase